ncbi:MAG: hypothetical protein EXR44_08475 [Dehalococcoidia bacterium]|nr:hypothetical protein [Dehalococcoidia bacterium]
MSFGDISSTNWIMLAVGWIHAIAATAWVGGSIFFALVLRPVFAVHRELAKGLTDPIGNVYRELVDTSTIALIVSGLVLMFNRLTGDDTGPVYFIVLGVKLVMAAWMFYVVWHLRRTGWKPEPGKGVMKRLSWLLGYNAVMAFGVVIFLLAEVLRQLYEAAVAS